MHLAELTFVIALVLYSWAIWSHRLGNNVVLKSSMIVVFGIAVTVDTLGTIFVCGKAGPTVFNLHTVFGFASLGIMAWHFGWAVHSRRSIASQLKFSYWSVPAWAFWLVAFLTGIPWSKIAAAS